MTKYSYKQIKVIEKLLKKFFKLWCKYHVYFDDYLLGDAKLLNPKICYLLIKFQHRLAFNLLPFYARHAWQDLMSKFYSTKTLRIRILKKDVKGATIV